MDFRSSIKDRRYNEQPFRLQKISEENSFPLKIIYLLEGNLASSYNQHLSFSLADVEKSLLSQQILNSFSIKNTSSLLDTLSYFSLFLFFNFFNFILILI